MQEFSKKYLEILKTDFAGLNLTRILDEDEFFQKQIMDSILPAQESEVFKRKLAECEAIIDIGFGGGFPILPLAKIFPEKKFIGFEARGKKAKAVSEIAKKLEIKNVKLYHQRFEEVDFDKKVLITFKAVSTIPELLSQIITTSQISVFFYKGPSVFELENLSTIEKDWLMIDNCKISLPGVENRTLLGFQNKIVLRGTNKKLVKVSSFF
jgi:16S rRNA (guanine527-N7)-methyltransferase